MKMVSDSIRAEAKECEESSKDQRNAPEDRNIFHVVSIILNGIAEKIERKPFEKPE